MPLLETFLLSQFAAFALVLARVGALVMTAPILSTQALPARVRAFFAVALTLIITPMHAGATGADPTQLPVFARYLASEALLGLLLGLGMTVFLSGIQLTGQVVSQLGGTALAEAFDPAVGESAPFYSQLFYFLTIVMFLLLNGHRVLLEALLDTYQWLPPGKAALGESYLEAMTLVLTQSFLLGLRAAAPTMTALLLSTLMLGLIGRTLPQINVLVVGFGVNALLTLGSLFFSLGAICWAFPQQASAAVEILRNAIHAAAAAAP